MRGSRKTLVAQCPIVAEVPTPVFRHSKNLPSAAELTEILVELSISFSRRVGHGMTRSRAASAPYAIAARTSSPALRIRFQDLIRRRAAG
jgi:hypothetical protein